MTQLETSLIATDPSEVEDALLTGEVLWTIEGRPQPHLPQDRVPSASEISTPETFAETTAHSLAKIEARLKAGANYQDFDSIVDDLLGTAMEERDHRLETDFQDTLVTDPS